MARKPEILRGVSGFVIEGTEIMKLPSFIYRSERMGKGGKAFSLYKIRTLKPTKGQFAREEEYTRFGKFLRKTKLDEFLQIFNILKGEMRLVGPRPDFKESYEFIPAYIREILLSVKPGLTSLASIHFYDEERLLKEIEKDEYRGYWMSVKPAKILLDVFYVKNRCFLLDVAVLYLTAKEFIKSFFK